MGRLRLFAIFRLVLSQNNTQRGVWQQSHPDMHQFAGLV